ncbi:Quinol monooxygenase YgiN [Sphingomonas laterariae]|uniref:Quinol monooxygenase YgiN n=1 Tax=Edaphosphingomonas laterariae TaxID=861865 RepID=A0A239E0C7_9SPHN|nr:putative quinol monooxygenase [Sphingomonas laterariae]SNS37354.1 Quinol monooxygenase YgiN [Sphingomonas laterariae]
MERRAFIAGTAAAAVLGTAAGAAPAGQPKYGLIGRMLAKPGQRDALVAILLDGVADMPGCLSYIVAEDPDDANAIWITEAWDSEASHKASLALPGVQAAIGKARPLIAGMDNGRVTRPIGGHGLK